MPKILSIIAQFSLKLLLVAMFAVLIGCQTTQLKTGSSDAQSVRNAEALLIRASKNPSPEKEYYQLQAADLFAQAKKFNRADVVLAAIDEKYLPDAEYLHYVALYTHVAKTRDDYFQVRALTTSARLVALWDKLSREKQVEILTERADVLVLLGDHKQGVEAFNQLAALVQTVEDKTVAHNKIWFVVNNLSFDRLSFLADVELNDELAGWYQLALAYREQGGNIRQQMLLFDQWRRLEPNHPAAIYPPTTLLAFNRDIAGYQHVALLLPTSGRLAQAGQAIQSGFLASWFEQQQQFGDSPEVSFYDTGGFDDITTVYQTALAAGADLVIGPLDKAAVTKLNAEGELTVPTISLNYLDVDVQPQTNLAQMGLSVTDEAEQVARRAWLEGARHALVVAPEASWAKKAVQAFSNGFEGRTDVLPPYVGSQQDFSALLSKALHIDQSTQRKQRLARVLGKKLDFTPRRRADVDMIFLVAYPDQARQIKPTINFLYASDLRVYATSHIYNGSVDVGRNRDLNGIKFSAMPWTLDGFLSDYLQPDSSIYSSFRQLYALGMDAYQLHQWLQQLKKVPGATLSGATGILELDGLGAVHRTHPWAVFKHGKVMPASALDKG